MDYRIGYSKDIHRLVEKRKLLLGGIEIPFDKGEDAHSDGDVLFHAVAEAILGSLALGDLGTHFPDDIDETKDMDSKLIVKKVCNMAFKKGYKVGNIDVFVSLEKPKLKDYIPLIRENVAKVLQTSVDNVSIKAGTNEKMGPVGEGKAIEATAIVLMKKINYC